ncbi:MAG: hypothetical protein A3H95_04800 [Acidobacteria bacterium RIFCSPLOWO2_02_FULL_64_15]|nr:MAG: hypothetical protein A3H95_04800 [Acidobacteria bacterium RIFCSPLOWO2_02_FULL_64_15]
MTQPTYAPDLVEEAVLLAEPTAPAASAQAFRRERDRIYEIVDDDAREASFRSLHLRWFARLGLHRVIDQVAHQRVDVADRVNVSRVVRALTRQDEGADLVDEATLDAASPTPTLVLRLCPSTLLRPDALCTLLHHELTHVADMLDPAFGYERRLPASEDGPSADNILRDRYRVLWDTTIDGRLTRVGLAGPTERTARWREFASAFAMLGEGCESAFEEWFNRTDPTHAGLVAFALTPPQLANAGKPGRCPLCRFPVASLDARDGGVSPATEAVIRAAHPAWRIELGLCSQCLDLYEARQPSCA